MGQKPFFSRQQTLVEKACTEITGFKDMYSQMERKLIISGKSTSTLVNYSRSITKVALYFKKIPIDLSNEQIEEYLMMLKTNKQPSPSYFKHTVYGLRYLFRIIGREDRAIKLPSLKKERKLPVVFSKEECRKLFSVPKHLKHRVMLALTYSAGLRAREVINLKPEDIDSDRMQIHIRQSKGRKDRYVVLSDYILEGLRKYWKEYSPVKWLFNGNKPDRKMGVSGVQWIMREAMKKTNIRKKATIHTLRHSFATHLLEDGVDIFTIKEQLGHATIQTTMVYLHVARMKRVMPHSPLDTLYGKR